MNLTKYSFGWLDVHIENCAKAYNEYKKYSKPELVSSRLSKFGYKHLFSKSINCGLVNVGLMVHNVIDKQTGNKAKIFEKVFHQYHSWLVSQEELLFNQLDADVLSAPEFIGKHNHTPFISVFYNYIEGKQLTAEDKEISKYELIKKLWTTKPTKQIIENCINKDSVDLLLDEKYINRLLDASNTDLDRIIIKFLKVNANKIIDEFRSLPRIIMHQDINHGNIIKSYNNDFYLIDWDKWCVSNVGAGLIIQPEEIFNPSLMRLLILFNGEKISFIPGEILRNVCIYNLTHELRLNNTRNAINWSYNLFCFFKPIGSI